MIYDKIVYKDVYNNIMPEKELDNLRDQINELDNQMLDILDQRSYIVTEIGRIKDKTKGVIDENREQVVIDRLINLFKGKYSKSCLKGLFFG